MHFQMLPGGRWAARYRSANGRQRRTVHRTQDEARTAAAIGENGAPVYSFREGDYHVGRYRLSDGSWAETKHGFDTAADALAEARELEQAARAGAAPEA